MPFEMQVVRRDTASLQWTGQKLLGRWKYCASIVSVRMTSANVACENIMQCRSMPLSQNILLNLRQQANRSAEAYNNAPRLV